MFGDAKIGLTSVYTARLLDVTDTIRIGCFTMLDGDMWNTFESNLGYF